MEKTYRVLIIDDEEGARESLRNILNRYFQDLEVVGTAHSAESGIEAINKFTPDLVFLDIEMPFGTAFDLLSKFDSIDFELIFVTAYDHYAIKAIKFSALDYLLKPVDIDDLREALDRFRKRKEQRVPPGNKLEALLENLKSGERPKKIAIPDTDGLLFVTLDDIIRCESDGNYTSIMLKSGKRVLASKTLGDYEDLFKGEQFFRTHRSHLINLSHIVKYVKGEGGYVILSDGSQVEISRRKKTDFLELMSKI